MTEVVDAFFGGFVYRFAALNTLRTWCKYDPWKRFYFEKDLCVAGNPLPRRWSAALHRRAFVLCICRAESGGVTPRKRNLTLPRCMRDNPCPKAAAPTCARLLSQLSTSSWKLFNSGDTVQFCDGQLNRRCQRARPDKSHGKGLAVCSSHSAVVHGGSASDS